MSMLNTQEHIDLMNQFEKTLPRLNTRGRLDREDKSLWPKGIIYCDGQVNELFLAYRWGYAFGLCVGREQS